MYEKLDRSGDGVVGYYVGGEVTEDDLEAMLEDLEAVIHEEGSVSLLVRFDEVPGVEWAGLDEDIGFWLQHGEDIERYAVVGDSALVDRVADLEDRVLDVDIEHFRASEVAQAWAWLRGESGEEN